VAIAHIYKDACRLAQAKRLARLIYHEPALEVRFVRKAMGTTSFLTIRQMSRLLRIYPDVASNSPKNGVNP
jgi:hypothetical protein